MKNIKNKIRLQYMSESVNGKLKNIKKFPTISPKTYFDDYLFENIKTRRNQKNETNRFHSIKI